MDDFNLYLMLGHVTQSNWLCLWTRVSLRLPRLTFLIYISPFPSFFSILLLLIVRANPSLERSSPSSSALAETVTFHKFVSFTLVSHPCSHYFLFPITFQKGCQLKFLECLRRLQVVRCLERRRVNNRQSAMERATTRSSHQVMSPRKASPGCWRGKCQPNLLTRNWRVIERKTREL